MIRMVKNSKTTKKKIKTWNKSKLGKTQMNEKTSDARYSIRAKIQKYVNTPMKFLFL